MAEIDSLEIKLKSNAQDVAKGFDALTQSIKNTSQSMNGMKADELDKTAKAIKSLNRSSSTDKLEKGLQNISNAINTFANNLKTIDTTKLDNIADKIDKIGQVGARKLQSTVKAVDNMNNSFANTSGMKLTEQELASIDNMMSKVKDKVDNTSFDFDAVRNAMPTSNVPSIDYGTQVTDFINAYSEGIDVINGKLESVAENIKGRLTFDPSQIATGEAFTASYIDLQKQIENAEGELEKYLNTQERLNQVGVNTESQRYKNVEISIENADKKLQQLYADMQRLQSSGGATFNVSDRLQQSKLFVPSQKGDNQRYTKAYSTLEKQIQKAEQRLNDLLQKQRTFSEEGNIAPQRFKNLELSIKEADGKLQALNDDMRRLQVSGADIENVSPYENLSQKMSGVQGVSQSLAKALRAIGARGAASGIQSIGANVGSLSSGLAGATTAAEGTSAALVGMQTAIPVIGLILAAVTVLVKAFTSLAKAAVNAFKKIVSAIQNVVGHIKTLVTNILSIGTSSYQAQTIVGKFINKMINMFKSRVLRQAVTQAIQYMKEGFKELDSYSESIGTPFHNNIATLVADLKYLGRSIATAFEPIVNIAAPILDFLIKKIVTVINYINQFFSALSGSSTWTKATYGAESYGDAASGAAKSQKDLNKAIREWDKLNVITDPNKGSGGGGGSSSGGGGGFTTENVESPIKNLAERIKETWEKTADFTWLGEDIGNKVKEKLDGIQWEEKIKPAAAKFGKALATLINGFVETPGLDETIGKTIAEAINTVFTGFEAFTEYIHGDSIGTFIGNLVKSALSKIEWDKYITGMGNLGRELAKGINALAETDVLSEISKAFAKILKGAIEGAYQFVTNIKFDELGKKVGTAISDFFKEMNEAGADGKTGFQKLGETVSSLAGGIMDFISNALDSLNWDEIGQSVIDFVTAIDWGSLFLKAMELKEKIKNAAWEAIKLAFKSITIAEGDIAIDIAKAIKDKWDNAKDWLKDKALDIGINVGDFVKSVKDKWDEIKQWLVDKALDIVANLPNIVGDIQAKVGEIKQWLTTNLLDIGLNIKDSASSVISNIVDKWNKLGEKKKELKAKVTGGAVDAIKKIKDAWKNLKGNTKNFTVNLKGKALELLNKVKTVWDSLTGKAKSLSLTFQDTVTSKIRALWNGIATKINGAIDVMNKVPGVNISHVKTFATGGFPEDGWFRASHGEYFGKFDNGQSVIANNKQIENGLMNTVRAGNSELVSLMAQELTAIRQQNELLRQILAKDSNISYKDIFKAAQQGNREFKAMNGGVSAFI